MKKTGKKKLVIMWREKPSKKNAKVKFAGCGSDCYSGTCDSCRN